MTTLDQVLAVIRGHRFRYSDEEELQEGIAAALTAASLDVEREVRLDDHDRIDILVGTIGIEVKVAGSAESALAQLQRYATHPEIEHLVLITSQWQRLPKVAGTKPLTTVSLAAGAL
jgi:hypothetical protein